MIFAESLNLKFLYICTYVIWVQSTFQEIYPRLTIGCDLLRLGDGRYTYRKISNIRRTKSQNLNVSRFVLQLSSPNPMKPGVKSRMKI